MKIIILIGLMLYGLNCYSQTGITYVLRGYWYDKSYEKIICCDTFIDWGDGSIPGWYHKVRYDYGEPPPNSFEIVQNYFNQGTKVRGWTVEYKLLGEMDLGDYGFFRRYLVTKTDKKAVFFDRPYTDTLFIDYGEGDLDISVKPTDWDKNRSSGSSSMIIGDIENDIILPKKKKSNNKQ